jgi:serine/threonine-protein kinase RsbW
MRRDFSLVIGSDVAEIPGMNEAFAAHLSAQGVPVEDILDIQLAVEEAVTNIIRYGYRDKTGTIRIHCTAQPDFIEIVIRDEAVPFDPLSVSPPDTTAGAEDRPVGGLGIMLIRSLMQDIRYAYENGQNVLTLRKMRNTRK